VENNIEIGEKIKILGKNIDSGKHTDIGKVYRVEKIIS